ncbi:MAG: galactokinase, partial [Solirubrobacteraceae bacterium]
MTVRARAIPGRRIEAVAADLGQRDGFELDDVRSAPGWRAHVRGAVAELQRAGVSLRGARLLISADLPAGGGLASSAALEVALTLALAAISDAPAPHSIELAAICSRIEHDWAGAHTGMLDQLASLLGQRGRALRIDFRSLDVVPVTLELGACRLVTLDSGERHSHADSGYNERRAECAQACELLAVESLREATLEMLESLPPPLDRRVRHVITENQRVEDAVAAL